MNEEVISGFTILGNVTTNTGFNASIGLTRPQGSQQPKVESFLTTENLFYITTESGDFLIIFQ